jgi:CubicO group peptidase (beta-lactamase class C family)
VAIDFVYWLAKTQRDHAKLFADAQSRGYRTVSLSVSGTPQAPQITAVMVNDPARPLETFKVIAEADWTQTMSDMAAQGVGPYIVSAVGPSGTAMFAAVFRPIDTSQLVVKDLNERGLGKEQDLAWRNGSILGSIDAYGTQSDPRFVAIWIPNSAPVAWNLDAASALVPLLDFRARLDAITAQQGRLSLVTALPDQRHLGLFVDDMVSKWRAEFDLGARQLTTLVTRAQGQGLAPLRISAKSTSTTLRFSVILADSEQPLTRTFRAQGPTTIAAFDTVVQTFLQKNATRGAALAITSGTKLVYAKGYTLAEANQPDVLPTTLFRLASVSKLLCAIAVYQLIQARRLALDTTIQTVLGLKTPNGGSPVDPRFGCVTVRDLLTMTSAVDQGAFWQSVACADASGKPLPATPEQMLSYIASRPLSDDPGNWDDVDYNNTGYLLLGQIVARLRGEADFAAAIVKPLLDPLSITRIRSGRSLLQDQPADETRHYLSNLRRTSDDDGLRSLDIGASERTPARPLVPVQYGVDDYEMFGGGGGLSAAATDLARILAALTWRDARNPMLSADSLQALFGNAVRATAALTGPHAHGYFGWDGAWLNTDGSIVAAKGGWLGGNQSFAWLSTRGDGLGIVLLINTNEQDDSGFGFGQLLNDVAFLASSQDWTAAADLFSSFGMPPLVPKIVIKQPPILSAAPPPRDQVRHAIAVERAAMVRPPAAEPPARPRAVRKRKTSATRR